MKYSGFLRRVIAYLIDGFILAVPISIIASGYNFENAEILESIELNVIAVIITWIYYIFSESSEWQATLGKKAMGIYVTDLEGNRLTVGRAFFRQFGKIASNFILGIGFLFPLFTEKKQALHDMIAGTVVLRDE